VSTIKISHKILVINLQSRVSIMGRVRSSEGASGLVGSKTFGLSWVEFWYIDPCRARLCASGLRHWPWRPLISSRTAVESNWNRTCNHRVNDTCHHQDCCTAENVPNCIQLYFTKYGRSVITENKRSLYNFKAIKIKITKKRAVKLFTHTHRVLEGIELDVVFLYVVVQNKF